MTFIETHYLKKGFRAQAERMQSNKYGLFELNNVLTHKIETNY